MPVETPAPTTEAPGSQSSSNHWRRSSRRETRSWRPDHPKLGLESDLLKSQVLASNLREAIFLGSLTFRGRFLGFKKVQDVQAIRLTSLSLVLGFLKWVERLSLGVCMRICFCKKRGMKPGSSFGHGPTKARLCPLSHNQHGVAKEGGSPKED